MLTYNVKLEPQKDGGYTIMVPVLPGCISEGNTIEEALNNIKDAIEGYLIVMAKHKRKVPVEIVQTRSVDVFKRSSYKRQKHLINA